MPTETSPEQSSLTELAEQIERLEAWANDFSCSGSFADLPIFTTKAFEEECRKRLAAHRERALAKARGEA